ncbi:Protein PTHB1 [Bagarius yarrelli]|uniref:Protein PTHB1 n=1 Tax=Bagarius yarrelli TaxID=175774 RepID=A0A556U738_BAGYA|nr:Protein PTHB1 [Bagarius yarrelli]
MSLFKARDWWSAVLGEGEEFDQGCLCVGDVDNSGSGYDKVVVGSYMGMLRIFSPPRPAEHSGVDAQLLEVQLRDPIIQVEVGKFVSCSELLHLAVLHPRKLSIYVMTGTAGNVEHGDQYQLRLVYEHNLQRTACNMTYGPFGGVTGHHFICIQSMDGMLMFFEQESYAFGRFLPGFLLPGPLCYCTRTDAFITVSSSRQVECYRYETLAVATDADTRQNSEQQSKSSGKRLMFARRLPRFKGILKTWVWNESATVLNAEMASLLRLRRFLQFAYQYIPLDWYVPACPYEACGGCLLCLLTVFTWTLSSSSIFILGERNLFCLRDNGQIRFMKKLEYNPSCFLPYASVSEGTTNVLLANHNNMLLVYQDTTLKWAAQLACVPVAIRVANFLELRGLVVTLSPEGHLQCSYMGTDPSFFTAPKVDSREVNYDEVDAEMKALQKVIREATRKQDIIPIAGVEDDLTVTCIVSPDLDEVSQAHIPEINGIAVPSVTVKIKVCSRSAVQCAKMSVCVQPPLAVTQDQFALDTLDSGSQLAFAFSAFLNGHYTPADLTGDVAVSYILPTGVPRVAQCKFVLPLHLVCCPTTASKNAKYKITVDTNKPPINFSEAFPEKTEDKEGNTLAFQFIAGSRVTVLASKTSQRYRIQSESFEDIWLVAKELVQRFEQHFAKFGVKDFRNSFSGPVPLAEYFEIVDHHFELRVNAQKYQDLLSERAVQFRAIQRRLLTRFKDKTPAPLQNLDTLMEGTYRQVIALADAAEENRACLVQAFSKLRSATHLLILLVSLWQGLSIDQTSILEATLLPLLQDTPQLGWEESVDAAVSHLLRTCLSRSPKDQAISLSTSQLIMPKDTSRLKKHITLLCDRIGKGGRLSLSSEANAPTPVMMPACCEAIPESIAEAEEEDLALQQEATDKIIKKKQPSKKVKSKTGSDVASWNNSSISWKVQPPITALDICLHLCFYTVKVCQSKWNPCSLAAAFINSLAYLLSMFISFVASIHLAEASMAQGIYPYGFTVVAVAQKPILARCVPDEPPLALYSASAADQSDRQRQRHTQCSSVGQQSRSIYKNGGKRVQASHIEQSRVSSKEKKEKESEKRDSKEPNREKDSKRESKKELNRENDSALEPEKEKVSRVTKKPSVKVKEKKKEVGDG